MTMEPQSDRYLNMSCYRKAVRCYRGITIYRIYRRGSVSCHVQFTADKGYFQGLCYLITYLGSNFISLEIKRNIPMNESMD